MWWQGGDVKIMSLNKKLMDLFKKETGQEPIYKKNMSTFHTLKYVDWLENRNIKLEKAIDSFKWVIKNL